jgi:hypothetical protein
VVVHEVIRKMVYEGDFWLQGGIMSEDTGGFLLLQISKINIPKHYPKLMHPLHGNDKIEWMLIIYIV